MYQPGNTYVARSRPAKVSQTANMQTCSANFGMASKAGKLLRQGLATVLPNVTDTHMQRRFSGCINKWLGKQPLADVQPQSAIAALEGFSFTENTFFYEGFKPRLLVTILPDGRVEISIPAFVPTVQIAAPAHTGSVELCIGVTACQLATANPAVSNVYKKQIVFNSDPQAAETVVFNMAPLQQKLVMVVASLRYFFC